MSEATFTFRVEENLKAAFSEAAKSKDQTGAQLLRGFMRDYVREQQTQADYDDWFQQQVRSGLDAANSGSVLSNDAIEAEFEARRDKTRRTLSR